MTHEKSEKLESWSFPNSLDPKYADILQKKCSEDESRDEYIDDLTLSREEAIVHVMAHELRHLWQSGHSDKRDMVWGSREKLSDRDADAYAIRKTREWRKLVSIREVYPSVPW